MRMPPVPALPYSWKTYTETGVWFRAIQLGFWSSGSPLSTAHTVGSTTRFGPGAKKSSVYRPTPSFPLLYLAENPMVALFEVGSLLGSPYASSSVIPHPRTSWVTITVKVNLLNSVVDLADASELDLIDSNAEEMTGDWFGYGVRTLSTAVKPRLTAVGAPVLELAPTQDLGIALNGLSNVDAFYAISAKVPTSRNLVIFPDKLLRGNWIEFIDPTSGTSNRIDGEVPRS